MESPCFERSVVHGVLKQVLFIEIFKPDWPRVERIYKSAYAYIVYEDFSNKIKIIQNVLHVISLQREK